MLADVLERLSREGIVAIEIIIECAAAATTTSVSLRTEDAVVGACSGKASIVGNGSSCRPRQLGFAGERGVSHGLFRSRPDR